MFKRAIFDCKMHLVGMTNIESHHKQFKMILGTPKDAFKWFAELSENAWQMCARSPEAFLYGEQKIHFLCVLPGGER